MELKGANEKGKGKVKGKKRRRRRMKMKIELLISSPEAFTCISKLSIQI